MLCDRAAGDSDDGRHFPAVLVTGSATPSNAEEERSRAAGFCVHLTKPVTFDRLLRAIHDCVEQN